MIETRTTPGLEHEPTPVEVVRSGADLVCFSGDKLFGGPQAGMIAGRAKLIAGLKREPFFRALRCDKLTLSALETLVDAYLRQDNDGSSQNAGSPHAQLPTLAMLAVTNEELLSRANAIIGALKGLPISATAGTGRAQLGGGTLPRSEIASVTLEITHPTWRPQELAARLRDRSVPIAGYIEHGKLKLDLRTVFPRQDAELIRAIRSACLTPEMKS